MFIFYFDLEDESSQDGLEEREENTNKLWQINHRAVFLEDSFRYDKTTRQRSPPSLPFLLNTDKHFLQAVEIIMVVPTNSRTRDFDALLDSKVDGAISNDDVSSLAEGGNDRRYGGKSLRVQNSSLCAEEICNIILQAHVDI